VRVRGEYKTNREDAINKTMVRSLAQPKKQCNVASDEGSVGFGAKKSAVLGGGVYCRENKEFSAKIVNSLPGS